MIIGISDAVSGWAGWALAHLEFGSSVNPFPTMGTDFSHRITACPPGFENLVASLQTDVCNIIITEHFFLQLDFVRHNCFSL